MYLSFISLLYVDDMRARIEGGVNWNDPCFKKVAVAKGPSYYIENDKVCMEFERGVNYAFTKTLESADVATFRQISMDYFADKNHVYYRDKIIIEANPKTFKRIGTYGIYYEDGKDVYCNGKKIAMDLDSMQFIENKKSYPGEYVKDKNHLWKRCKIVENNK